MGLCKQIKGLSEERLQSAVSTHFAELARLIIPPANNNKSGRARVTVADELLQTSGVDLISLRLAQLN